MVAPTKPYRLLSTIFANIILRNVMNKKLFIIGIGFVGALLLWLGFSILPEWLWFENLGFSPVLWTMLLSKFGFGFLVWLLLALIIGANIYAANRLSPRTGTGGGFKIADDYVSQFGLPAATPKTLVTAFILFLTFYIALKGSIQWDLLLRYLYQQPFSMQKILGACLVMSAVAILSKTEYSTTQANITKKVFRIKLLPKTVI